MQKISIDKRALRALAAFIVAVPILWVGWETRQMWHGLVMLCYQYPLLTVVPIMAAVATSVASYRLGLFERSYDRGFAIFWLSAFVGVVFCAASAIFLWSWQGKATYEGHTYTITSELPQSTVPRLMPKDGAKWQGLSNTHLAVDPSSHSLVWSGVRAPGGVIPRGESGAVYTQPLDQTDGVVKVYGNGFSTTPNQVGPGSIKWRAYGRHYFTRVTDPVVVPTGGGKSIVVAPYLGYHGFLVKHPYLKGVYVLHQDGRLEDLTPEQARKRPELVASGRIFPESLAKDIAEAYGYKNGVMNTLPLGNHREQLQVHDFGDNPQPYLTQLGNGRVVWVTVMSRYSDASSIGAIMMTDASTGKTEVWNPKKGQYLLSNKGATKLARGLPLQWQVQDTCYDSDGYAYTCWTTVRSAEEARLAFKDGKPYYLVSIYYLSRPKTLEQTVLIDATTRTIVKSYDHSASAQADDELRSFFAGETPVGTP